MTPQIPLYGIRRCTQSDSHGFPTILRKLAVRTSPAAQAAAAKAHGSSQERIQTSVPLASAMIRAQSSARLHCDLNPIQALDIVPRFLTPKACPAAKLVVPCQQKPAMAPTTSRPRDQHQQQQQVESIAGLIAPYPTACTMPNAQRALHLKAHTQAVGPCHPVRLLPRHSSGHGHIT